MGVLKGQKAGEKGGKRGSLREEAKKTETGAGNQEPKPFLKAKCAVEEGFTARHVCLPWRS